MRVAVLSDVHANMQALVAVLAACRREGFDRLLCAGDLVGYGPDPNACVELLHDVGAVSVAGNHDLIAVGRLDDTTCSRLARASLQWTRDHLREDVARQLAALPLLHEDGVLLMAHGSPEDPTEYVTQAERADELLAQVAVGSPAVQLLVLGHTHHPWLHAGRTRRMLNPGSVGQSRDRSPDARFAVVDLESRLATLHRVPYDVHACREALRRQGLPVASCSSPPPGMLGRLARRLTRPVRDRLRR